MRREIYAVKRGNYPMKAFGGEIVDAPAVFIKEDKDAAWHIYVACHSRPTVEEDLNFLLRNVKVEHFDDCSKYFDNNQKKIANWFWYL